MPSETKFSQAVKSSLDALLTDLQSTTAVLKKANLSERYESEPVVLQKKMERDQHGLQDLELLLDDYDRQRATAKRESGRPSIEGLLGELDSGESAVVGADQQNTTTRPRPSASDASKGLDNLMGSLKDFKSSGGGGGAPPAFTSPPNKTPRELHAAAMPELESMLGNLQSDMSKHGISTIPKGDCAACLKTIVGQVVIALGKMWHPEHFVCGHCGEQLGYKNFFERSGKAYCELDYHNLFSPRCAYCNGPIKDKCVTALDKTWHTEHFFCSECGKDFGEDGFHEKDGKAYCRHDYFNMFAPRCRGCTRPITNTYITALGSQWHAECFVCQGESIFANAAPVYLELQ